MENSAFCFEITDIRFISFIITILGIYGFTCFQCKLLFTMLSCIFCTVIWWILNFPIANNLMNQQNPNWNFLILTQIVYVFLIIGLFFLLRLISNNQTSNRYTSLMYVINKTSHKQKILLLLLFIISIVFLFLISSNPSLFQIILIVVEACIGVFFVYWEKKHFSPNTVDFTDLRLDVKINDSDKYKVTFSFVNNSININDCYKIIFTDIIIEFAAIDETKRFFLDEKNINKNKINSNKIVLEVCEIFNKKDYDKFINKSFYPDNCPTIKLSFNYRVVHEKSEENIFYKLNNNYQRAQECDFKYIKASNKYIILQ